MLAVFRSPAGISKFSLDWGRKNRYPFFTVYMPTRRQRPARILLQPCQPKLASRVVTRGAKMMVPAPEPQVEIPATKQTIGFSEPVVLNNLKSLGFK